MEKLKPCPFCGGEAWIITGPLGRFSYVYCTECRAQGEPFEVRAEYCAKDEAIKAWNRRADK